MKLKPYRTQREAIWKYRNNPGEYFKGKRNRKFKTRQRKRPWDEKSYWIVATAWNCPLHPDGELMKPIHWDHLNRGDQFIFVGKHNRTLSIKECLAIQTFPESFKLKGDLISQYRQIGNAVPPVLSNKLALTIRNCLNGVKTGYCDHGCSKEKIKIKEARFLDTNSSLFKIDLCKKCFEEELKASWDNHKLDNIILK